MSLKGAVQLVKLWTARFRFSIESGFSFLDKDDKSEKLNVPDV